MTQVADCITLHRLWPHPPLTSYAWKAFGLTPAEKLGICLYIVENLTWFS